MKLIGNLEELKKGDWIKIIKGAFSNHRTNFQIGEIEATNDKVLQGIIGVNNESYRFDMGYERDNKYPDEKFIILKHPEKVKKKKLKHKLRTYNEEYMIFKLPEKSVEQIAKGRMLWELEK